MNAHHTSEPAVIGAGFDFADPRSRFAPYYLGTSHVIAVLLPALVFVLLGNVPLWHTDVWGHLKYGQWIVEQREVPPADPFCPYADPSLPAASYGWLSQVSLYMVFHAGELLAGGDHARQLAGGVALLRLSHAVLVLLRLSVLLVALRRASGSLPVACALFAGMLVLSAGHLAILRPQVLGELCFALVLLTLSRPTLSYRAVVLLPVLFIFWSNAHGTFLTGLMLLGGAALGRTFFSSLARKARAMIRYGI